MKKEKITAKWVPNIRFGHCLVCSNCLSGFDDDMPYFLNCNRASDDQQTFAIGDKWEFCPICGAKMHNSTVFHSGDELLSSWEDSWKALMDIMDWKKDPYDVLDSKHAIPYYIENKGKRLQLLLKPSTLEKLKAKAQREGRSVNSTVSTMLEKFIKED